MGWVFVAMLVFAIVAIGVAAERHRCGSGVTGFGGAGAFGVIDEIYHPSSQHTIETQEVERILPAPAPLAGDRMLDDGTVVIEIPASGEAAR